MTTPYQKAVNLLTSKEKFHIKLGLERISDILNVFDNPQEKLKIIHVAGTNGKGSVCSILNRILIDQGYKTALFTSPHLVKYTERLKINDCDISDEKFYELIREIDQKSNESKVPLTEFEVLTTAAFIWFARENVDVAVFETGLGGRLDATNVVKRPVLSIITSISKDHTDRLGSTIEEIAREKAGIIKSDVPCITTSKNNGLEVISKTARKLNAPLILTKYNITSKFAENKNFIYKEGKYYEFALKGTYQCENLSLAFNAIDELNKIGFEINNKAIEQGLKNVRHGARFEIIKGTNIILDGAHNPDGARALRESLDIMFPGKFVTFVYATINTKDYKTILKTLLKPCDRLYLLNFTRQNAVSASTLAEKIHKDVRIIKEIKDITKLATIGNEPQNPVVITGSLYAIGEIYENLQKNCPIG